RNFRPLVRGDREQQIGGRGRSTKHFLEGPPVLAHLGESGHDGIQTGFAHFRRIDDWKRSLLLERSGPPVPGLRHVVERVQYGRGVALSNTTLDANRKRAPVGERPCGVMTAAARYRAICRQPAVEEQLLPKRDLVRCLRIVGRYRRAGGFYGQT